MKMMTFEYKIESSKTFP